MASRDLEEADDCAHEQDEHGVHILLELEDAGGECLGGEELGGVHAGAGGGTGAQALTSSMQQKVPPSRHLHL